MEREVGWWHMPVYGNSSMIVEVPTIISDYIKNLP